MTNERRTHVIPGVDGACPRCDTDVEIATHLFLHYAAFAGLWSDPAINFDIKARNEIRLVIEPWLNMSRSDGEIFMIKFNLSWDMWKYRCKRVFERNPLLTDTVKAMPSPLSRTDGV